METWTNRRAPRGGLAGLNDAICADSQPSGTPRWCSNPKLKKLWSGRQNYRTEPKWLQSSMHQDLFVGTRITSRLSHDTGKRQVTM